MSSDTLAAPLQQRLRSPGQERLRGARGFFVWLSAWVTLALCLVGAGARGDEPLRIPIVFHVAQQEGAAVASEAFLAEQLAAANAIYGPLGIELVDHAREPLAAVHAELVTRADRDALAPYVKMGAIHCFIVAKLMDVDEPGRERRGVHWRPRPAPLRSFVIVSKISRPYVLAHELGHFLGNRKHSQVAGNLMSYKRAEGPPFLNDAQIRRVRETLAALLKRGAIVPVANEVAAAE